MGLVSFISVQLDQQLVELSTGVKYAKCGDKKIPAPGRYLVKRKVKVGRSPPVGTKHLPLAGRLEYGNVRDLFTPTC